MRSASTGPPAWAKRADVWGDRVALQGNLDPLTLFATPEVIAQETRKVLDDFHSAGPGGGHVFNLGHGISQFTPPENVSVLVIPSTNTAEIAPSPNA